MTKSLTSSGRPANVLLVEDNDNDAELTRLGFERARFKVNLYRVLNGEECMKFLLKTDQYVNAPTPDLVLLDLNMPRMNGQEVLTEIEKHKHLAHIPIIVLSTSDGAPDILSSYKLRCRSYIVKPIDFNNFAKAIQTLGDYWFTLVVLPPDKSSQDLCKNNFSIFRSLNSLPLKQPSLEYIEKLFLHGSLILIKRSIVI